MTRTARPTFFKHEIGLVKVQKALRKSDLKAHETREMDAVRRRDHYCRVPFCGCKKLKMRLEVAHSTHRGAGGNPDGTRTDRGSMVRVCFARHRTLPISLDKGTLRWVALTDAGAAGPIEWQVDMNAVVHYRQGAPMVLAKRWERPSDVLLLEMAEMRW